MDGISLVKEGCRQSGYIEGYNDNQVRALISGLNHSYEEACKLVEEEEEQRSAAGPRQTLDEEEGGNSFRMLLMQNAMVRAKRCLLTYHKLRLDQISGLTLGLPTFPAAQRSNLSKAEAGFQQAYADSIGRMVRGYGGMLSLTGAVRPPKDLFVTVRVLKDCGVVQTEYGPLYLDAGSFHFVRKSDVEHLITQGFLLHMK